MPPLDPLLEMSKVSEYSPTQRDGIIKLPKMIRKSKVRPVNFDQFIIPTLTLRLWGNFLTRITGRIQFVVLTTLPLKYKHQKSEMTGRWRNCLGKLWTFCDIIGLTT